MVANTAGFGDLVNGVRFSERARGLLRATCDRFLEARFFAKQAVLLEPSPELLDEINWYTSAHIAAVIGVRDAARDDFERAGKAASFGNSDIAKEVFLRSDAPSPQDRDPLAINKAYWDLRNLRVHRAIPLVVLEAKVMMDDIAKDPENPKATPRWFMRQVDASEHALLRNPQLSADERAVFNARIADKTLGEVVYHHL